MRKADLKAFKEKLLAMRARLRGDITRLADAALNKGSGSNGSSNGMPIHLAEVGSDNFEQEFTLSLMQSDEDTLSAIEHALESIEAGTYGTCEECETTIPKARLNAIPYATLCVKCASRSERS